MAKKINKGNGTASTPTISYIPEPTSERMHRSNAKFLGLSGSLGTGKTTTMVMHNFFLGCQQNIHPETKVRESVVLIARSTYPELKTVVAVEINKWFGHLVVHESYNNPHIIELDFADPDPHLAKQGVRVHIKFVLMALDLEPESRVKSWNISWVYFNEADTMRKEAFDAGNQRADRHPAPIDEVNPYFDPNLHDDFDPTAAKDMTVEQQRKAFKNPKFIRVWPGNAFGGALMDWNPTATSHWIYKMMEVDKIRNRHGEVISKVFAIPSPLLRKKGDIRGGYFYRDFTYFPNPLAEGVRFQSSGLEYWYTQMQNKDDRYIRRYIMGQYVETEDGEPVFSTFEHDKHISTIDLKFNPHRKVMAIFDFGFHAACVFAQVDDMGKLMVLKEFYKGSIGMKYLLKDHIGPALQNEFKLAEFEIIGDPSGTMDDDAYMSPFMEIKEFFQENGFDVIPKKAKTNTFLVRFEHTNSMFIGEDIIFDRSCKQLISAAGGNYRYEEDKEGNKKETVVKDVFSHLMDCVQYVCCQYRMGSMSDAREKKPRNNPHRRDGGSRRNNRAERGPRGKSLGRVSKRTGSADMSSWIEE